MKSGQGAIGLVGGVAAVLALAGAAAGQNVKGELVRGGLVNPVFVASPPGDYTRLYIIQQHGVGNDQAVGNILVHNLVTNTTDPTPLLTLTNLPLPPNNLEQGILGLAFDPGFATNRYVYINYTSNATANGRTIIARYQTVAGNPNLADPASATNVLTLDQVQKNHNGGWLAFGPDGFFYAALGDGGGGGDGQNYGQNKNVLFGKILRLDVSTLPYTVPADNPWVGIADRRPETWAWGLRNPWRPSFDRQTGDLWITDVGQNSWEEVNFQPAAGAPPHTARNYGWRCYEGNHAFNLTGCDPASTMTFPVFEMSSQDGSGNCSITGGYVYRGCKNPELRGVYFFSDWCAGKIWSFRLVGGQVTDFTDRTAQLTPPGGPPPAGITSFGEDANGELYFMGNGNLWRIAPKCYANCDASTETPNLNVADFTCFLQRFAAQDCWANCDDSTQVPRLNVADFTCFLQKFASGCP